MYINIYMLTTNYIVYLHTRMFPFYVPILYIYIGIRKEEHQTLTLKLLVVGKFRMFGPPRRTGIPCSPLGLQLILLLPDHTGTQPKPLLQVLESDIDMLAAFAGSSLGNVI